MATHVLGNTNAPTWGYNIEGSWDEIGSPNALSMPANGYVVWVAGYFGANSGTGPARWLLFDGSGNLLGYSGVATVGGVAWYGQNLQSPVYRSAGSAVAGGWLYGGGTQKFYVYSGGNWKAGAVGGNPSSISSFGEPGSPYVQGGIGYYLQWIDPLSVSGVSPNIAPPGATVTITGGGFTGGAITSITFNGIGASSWSVVDDNHINVVVPSGNASGTLQVNSDHGSGTVNFVASTVYAFDGGSWQVTASNDAFSGSSQQIISVLAFDGSNWQQLA